MPKLCVYKRPRQRPRLRKKPYHLTKMETRCLLLLGDGLTRAEVQQRTKWDKSQVSSVIQRIHHKIKLRIAAKADDISCGKVTLNTVAAALTAPAKKMNSWRDRTTNAAKRNWESADFIPNNTSCVVKGCTQPRALFDDEGKPKTVYCAEHRAESQRRLYQSQVEDVEPPKKGRLQMIKQAAE